MTDLQPLYRHIDDTFERHLERIRAFVRQPSISGEGVGMQEIAGLVVVYDFSSYAWLAGPQ